MAEPDGGAPSSLPELRTARLVLRGLVAEDATWIARLAGDFEVARFTGLPHPMDGAVAREWMEKFLTGDPAIRPRGWGVRIAATDEPIGGGSLRFDPGTEIARMGFWLGREYWGRGYGGEYARALTDFAFAELDARRLEADCIADNEASARILESCGLRREGVRRGAFARFGTVHDLCDYGRLRTDAPPG